MRLQIKVDARSSNIVGTCLVPPHRIVKLQSISEPIGKNMAMISAQRAGVQHINKLLRAALVLMRSFLAVGVLFMFEHAPGPIPSRHRRCGPSCATQESILAPVPSASVEQGGGNTPSCCLAMSARMTPRSSSEDAGCRWTLLSQRKAPFEVEGLTLAGNPWTSVVAAYPTRFATYVASTLTAVTRAQWTAIFI